MRMRLSPLLIRLKGLRVWLEWWWPIPLNMCNLGRGWALAVCPGHFWKYVSDSFGSGHHLSSRNLANLMTSWVRFWQIGKNSLGGNAPYFKAEFFYKRVKFKTFPGCSNFFFNNNNNNNNAFKHFSYWAVLSSLDMWVYALSYCILLCRVQLMSLGGLLFLREMRSTGSGGEGRWCNDWEK